MAGSTWRVHKVFFFDCMGLGVLDGVGARRCEEDVVDVFRKDNVFGTKTGAKVEEVTCLTIKTCGM